MEAERVPPPAPSLGRTLRSFSYAVAGLSYLVRTQPNFRVHIVAAVAVLGLAAGLGATAAEISVLVLSIGLVMVGEALNTALEAVVDLASPTVHPLARIAKDVAAAGVLIAAITSVVVGMVVLGPRLLALVPR